MRRKNLLKAAGLIFVAAPFIIFTYAPIPFFRSTTETGPTASIFFEPPSPVGPGLMTVKVITSNKVTKVPEPLVFNESDSSITMICLQGVVPGNYFMGQLEVDQNIAEGVGYFSLLSHDALIDEQGKNGSEIISGKYLRIDKTAPMQPQKFSATFDSSLYKN
ncbi:MAG: hypothetical protein ACE5HI_00840 [bacterium]